MRQKLTWIPSVLFWILFAASLGLARRYAWLDTIWYGALVLILLGLSAYSLVHLIRHRGQANGISYPGLPPWLRRFFFDEREDETRR